MQAVVHRRHGAPREVLETITVDTPTKPPPGHALIRVAFAPIHPGDVQAISASPTFGDPVEIPSGGRVPGLEGVGTVTAVADDVDVAVGTRVAFFPVPGTWCETVVAPVGALVPLPDSIADETAAHMLIDTATANLVVRAGHDALPADERVDVTVVQTGASSAVGRLITVELIRRGVGAVRLVRSRASADRLSALLPGRPVVAADEDGWQDRVRHELGDARLWVVLDGVAGPLLGQVSPLLRAGGTVINYGSLGGVDTDLRWIVPRQLTVKGVSVLSWLDEPDDVRRGDVDAALRIAEHDPDQFRVAAIYPPDQIVRAAEHADRGGRDGAILLDFRES